MLCHQVAKARIGIATREDGVPGPLASEVREDRRKHARRCTRGQDKSLKIGSVARGAFDGLIWRDGGGDAEAEMRQRSSFGSCDGSK